MVVPTTLRERSIERRKQGGVSLHDAVGEGVGACLEVDDGLIKVGDNPAHLKSHRRTVRGFENEFAGKLRRRTIQVTKATSLALAHRVAEVV